MDKSRGPENENFQVYRGGIRRSDENPPALPASFDGARLAGNGVQNHSRAVQTPGREWVAGIVLIETVLALKPSALAVR